MDEILKQIKYFKVIGYNLVKIVFKNNQIIEIKDKITLEKVIEQLKKQDNLKV